MISGGINTFDGNVCNWYLSFSLHAFLSDHHSNALPTELSHYLVVCGNHLGLYKAMLY